MQVQEQVGTRAQAAEEFKLHEDRRDAERVVESLVGGLTLLTETCQSRVFTDVLKVFPQDSMQVRFPAKGELSGKHEIDLLLVAESASFAGDQRLIRSERAWYASWLAALRLGETAHDPQAQKRLAIYADLPGDGRRLAFQKVLDKAIPESRRAPLVLLRLLPLAAGIVTAAAFGNLDLARSLRKQQTSLLPAILDCHRCHGRLLDCGDTCPECGNPLWKYNWLTS
ncbi:MAG TPA: hypothetical protein VFV87_00710 [Pirellulaceae bacterium]|nr:hypothetical protein [Pirellulaceae bacterium]